MYNNSKKMFTRRAKPIRIIGDPDNERPDKWSSTVPLCFIRVGSPKQLSEHNRQVTTKGSSMNAWLQGNSMRAI